jgi:HAD superfamily hydrolase (TIGR01509 family)
MVKAVIFDMDGVIVDSEIRWKETKEKGLAHMTPQITKEETKHITGLNASDSYDYISKRHKMTLSKEDYLKQCDERAKQVYLEKCQLLPKIIETFERIKEKNIPMAVASSSPMSWVNMTMDRFELRKYFEHIVSAEIIDGPSKPHPDIYLFTAKKLGFDPKDCIAIEDSSHGVQAATSAGVFCYGLKNGFNEDQDLSKADKIIKSFDEIKV